MPARRILALAFALAIAGCGDDGARLPPDASPGPDGPLVDAAVGIECKTTFCDLPEFCCGEQLQPPRVTYYCGPGDRPEVCMGNRYFCDGPEDCGEDEVCCTGGVEGDVGCVPEGSCENYVVCHVTAHCPPLQACFDTPVGVVRACQ